jgi:hypothetical protein
MLICLELMMMTLDARQIAGFLKMVMQQEPTQGILICKKPNPNQQDSPE